MLILRNADLNRAAHNPAHSRLHAVDRGVERGLGDCHPGAVQIDVLERWETESRRVQYRITARGLANRPVLKLLRARRAQREQRQHDERQPRRNR
jgi:hypothetical protein